MSYSSMLRGDTTDTRGRANQVAASQQSYKYMNRGPTVPGQYLTQELYKGTDPKFNVHDTHVGKYLTPDPQLDTEMQFRKAYNDAKSPLGALPGTERVVQWWEDKRNQEQYNRFLALAGLMVDPDDPTSQERAYLIVPELQAVPEGYHTEILAMQEALRTMLKDGQIRSAEDLSLLMHILQPDTTLPTFPLWDPTGQIINDVKNDFKEMHGAYLAQGLFNPRRWDYLSEDERKLLTNSEQKLIKQYLMKRLFQPLRKVPLADVGKILDSWQTTSGLANPKGSQSGIPGPAPKSFADMMSDPMSTLASWVNVPSLVPPINNNING